MSLRGSLLSDCELRKKEKQDQPWACEGWQDGIRLSARMLQTAQDNRT